MRTTTTVTTAKSDEEIKDVIGNILVSKNFIFQKYKKQNVWKKGSGWLTAPQIFRINKSDDKLIIESWIPFALFPGVFLGESGLDSAFGFAVKIGMRNVLAELVNAVKGPDSVVEGYMPKK